MAEPEGCDDFSGLSKKTILGQQIQAGGRILQPVMQIVLWKSGGGRALVAQVRPLAILIIESENEYVLSLSDEHLTLSDLLEMSPNLQDVLKEARAARRMKID